MSRSRPPGAPHRAVAPLTPDETKAFLDAHPRKSMGDIDGTQKALEDGEKARATPQGLDALQKKLLLLLSQKKTASAAAAAMGWSESGLDVFLVNHRGFAKQRWAPMLRDIADKEKNLKRRGKGAAPPALVAMGDISWTDEMRSRLLEAYVDTGDLLAAQTLVGVTPSQFNRECDRDSEFAEAVKVAKKQASRTLELRAIADALSGNDKLLGQIMRDKDEDAVSRLTDAQLARRITGLVSRIRERAIASGNLGDESGGEAGADERPAGAGQPAAAEQVCDPLS